MVKKYTFCRICSGKCGLVVEVDENENRIVDIRGDHDHPMTKGFACIKGLQAAELHHGPQRLLHPLERQPDGSFREVELEVALDRIAQRMQQIIARDGANALATFRGTQHYANSTAFEMLSSFIRATRTRSRFSTMTIDQSAKWVVDHRLGIWTAGRQSFDSSDVWMFIGHNPMVSVQAINGFPALNPAKRLKEAKKRGMKIIVIDPRKTETAHYADLHLQPYPGEDPTLLAGLIRVVLENNWHDREFCNQFVAGVDELKVAVAPFSDDYVSDRTGVAISDLHQAAEIFARQCKRGIAVGGTGPDMAPHSNLTEQLIETLNAICGRFVRAGERVANPGPMSSAREVRAEVIAPKRPWEQGAKSRVRNLGMINGEKMTGALADEILTPGTDQIKALIIDGGNPVNALPERKLAIEAMRALELLVCIDPYLSETAELADYVIPPTLMFERPELPLLFEKTAFPEPFVQYTDAIIAPPKGSDVTEDWYVFWALAKRMGLPMQFAGVELDMKRVPTTEELLALLTRNAQIPFAKMKPLVRGKLIEMEEQMVAPAREDRQGNRLQVGPEDVVAELAQVFTEWVPGQSAEVGFPFRLSVRRHRSVMNTSYRQMSFVRKKMPENPLWIHPEDLAELGFSSGEWVELKSAYGQIQVKLEADKSMRRGVVSISHGWGGSGGEAASVGREEIGVSVNDIIPSRERIEVINSMPWYSALPVALN